MLRIINEMGLKINPINPSIVVDKLICQCLGPVGVTWSGHICDPNDNNEVGWLVLLDIIAYTRYYYVGVDNKFYIVDRTWSGPTVPTPHGIISLVISQAQGTIPSAIAEIAKASIRDYVARLAK